MMDEQASFEARAVLEPGRNRLSRLALLLPVGALVAVAWMGITGLPVVESTAIVPEPTTLAVPSPRPVHPTKALGLHVHRLGDLEPRRFGRDDVLAIVGWYVPTAITDCPPLPALYRAGSLPYLRGDTDTFAFCVRSGVLYAAESATSVEDNRSNAGVSAIRATVVVGVIMPLHLEVTEAGATEVVVLGRFVPSGDACGVAAACRRELVVDYVAWAREE